MMELFILIIEGLVKSKYTFEVTLSVKKKVGVKKSWQKIWSVKKLVTCPKFSHFLPPNFLF